MGFIPIWVLLSGSIKSWILLVRNRHQFWLVTVKSQKVQFSRKYQGDIGPDMGLYPDRRNLWWLIWNGYYESHFLKKLILATEFKNRIFMKVNCTQWYSAIKNNCKIKLGCKIAFWGLFESTLYQGFSGK